MANGLAMAHLRMAGIVVLVGQEAHLEATTAVFHKAHTMREGLHHHEATDGNLGGLPMVIPVPNQDHPEAATIYRIFHSRPKEYGMLFHHDQTYRSRHSPLREIETASRAIVVEIEDTMIVDLHLQI
jgi:hypothetical protein